MEHSTHCGCSAWLASRRCGSLENVFSSYWPRNLQIKTVEHTYVISSRHEASPWNCWEWKICLEIMLLTLVKPRLPSIKSCLTFTATLASLYAQLSRWFRLLACRFTDTCFTNNAHSSTFSQRWRGGTGVQRVFDVSVEEKSNV